MASSRSCAPSAKKQQAARLTTAFADLRSQPVSTARCTLGGRPSVHGRIRSSSGLAAASLGHFFVRRIFQLHCHAIHCTVRERAVVRTRIESRAVHVVPLLLDARRDVGEAGGRAAVALDGSCLRSPFFAVAQHGSL